MRPTIAFGLLLLFACTSEPAAPSPPTRERSPAASSGAAADPARAGTSDEEAEEAPPLTLLVTADNRGEYAPCGCRHQPAGGLDRRVALVRATRARGPTLVLDAGDALFADRGEADELARAQARLILDGMGAAGTAAMAVGERDLAAGGDWLLEQAKAAGVPIVAANLATASGKRPFHSSIVERVGDLRVGVIGLWVGAEPKAGWKISDPVEAAKAEVARLRAEGVDLIVALVHGSASGVASVAAVGGIDFLVASHGGASSVPVQNPATGTVSISAGSRGREMLRLAVHPAGDGHFVDASRAKRLRDDRAATARRLELVRARIPQLAGEMRRTHEQMEADLVARIERYDRDLAAAGAERGRRRFFADRIRLVESVGSDETIAGRMQAFRKRFSLDDGALDR